MDIIEKETVKEVPANYWCDAYGPYNSWNRGWSGNAPFASRGVAGAGLGLIY